MSLSVKTKPEYEPVSVDEVRAHLRIDANDEDPYLLTLIKAARMQAETFVRRKLITQELEWRLDEFPTKNGVSQALRVPVAPVQSVDSISYTDTDGDSQTLADYQFDLHSEPVRIAPAFEENWPSTQDIQNAITITLTAGYGLPTEIPKPIRQAILMMVGHYYEAREDSTTLTVREIPMSSSSLLWPYRTRLV